MMKSLVIAGFAGLVLAAATPALAECDSQQEAVVGKAIAEAAHDYLPDARGERFVDLKVCEGGGSKFDARFRYSVERDGESQWIEGQAQGRGGRVNTMSVKWTSRDLQASEHARADN